MNTPPNRREFLAGSAAVGAGLILPQRTEAKPWKTTLQKARALNRPLLISIGYFSCHWCHVMQRESYQDPALAKLINEHFVDSNFYCL